MITPLGYVNCATSLGFVEGVVNTPEVHVTQLKQRRGEENIKKQENT